MLSGLFFAVCTGLITMGIGIVTSSVSQKKLNQPLIQGIASIALMLFCLIGSLIMGHSFIFRYDFQWIAVIFLGTAGICNFLFYLFVERAMRNGHNGLIWAVVNAALIVPFLTGIFVFGDEASWLCWCGAIVIVAGIFAGGCKKKDKEPISTNKNYSWVFWTAISFIFAGVTQAANNIPSYFEGTDDIPMLQKIFMFQAGSSLIAVLTLLTNMGKTTQSDPEKKRSTVILTIILTLMNGFLFACMYKCFEHLARVDLCAIAYPLLSGISILGFGVYSLVFLKEKITLPVLLSLILIAIGSVFITM